MQQSTADSAIDEWQKRCLRVCVCNGGPASKWQKIYITQHQTIKQIVEKWNVVDYLAEIPVNLIWYLKLIRFCMAKLNWVSNMPIYHEVSKKSWSPKIKLLILIQIWKLCTFYPDSRVRLQSWSQRMNCSANNQQLWNR
jgi:hypothetical protein